MIKVHPISHLHYICVMVLKDIAFIYNSWLVHQHQCFFLHQLFFLILQHPVTGNRYDEASIALGDDKDFCTLHGSMCHLKACYNLTNANFYPILPNANITCIL